MRPGAASAAAFAALAILFLVPAAAAHSNLASSDPRAGARLDAAPPLVTLTMTEPVDPAATTVTVTDSAGHRVDAGDLRVETGANPVLRLHLDAGLPDGAYSINWQVLSGTDGHHTFGTVGFAVGAFTPPGSGAQSVNRLDLPAALSRALLYAGFSLAFGGAAFLAWMRRAGTEGLARSAVAWGAALHLAGTLVLVQTTMDEAGIHWGQLGGSAIGRILLARLLLGAAAWVLAMLAQARPTRTGPWAAVLLLLGAGLGAARLGHGSSDGPATIALDLLHLAATATWVGSLVLLLATLRRAARDGADPADLRAVGIRYGTLALACVVLLWATGSIVGLAILGRDAVLHPGATLHSAYGAFLAAKVSLAALMVALAALNRYVFLEAPTDKGFVGRLQRVARRASGGRAQPLSFETRGLRGAVAVEAFLGAAVLVLAGFLTSVSPPAADAAPAAPTLREQGDTYLVHLLVQPAARVGGSSVLTLVIEDARTGQPMAANTCGNPAASCVQAEVAYAGHNGTEVHEARLEGAAWEVHDLVWTRAGTATVKVDISTAEVFHDEVTFRVAVAP
ncbi:MAG TPA: copper resistance protein CopC [Candidatus Thermoplasmatota archaeon]|nr:copper resistance protein CopC [Candidatus Thermoplasmatota archaeon]